MRTVAPSRITFAALPTITALFFLLLAGLGLGRPAFAA